MVDLLARTEGLDDLKALQGVGLALLRRVVVGTVAQFVGQCVEVEVGEQVVDGLGTHLGNELVGIGVVKQVVVGIEGAVGIELGQLFLGQQVVLVGAVEVETLGVLASFEQTGLDDGILLIVDDGIELLGGHSEQVANLVGQRAEVPDMSHGDDEFDVTTAVAAHLLLGDLDAATVTDDALVADALVLATGTLVVACRAENALAEESVAFGLVRAIVNGLRFGYLTVGVLKNLLGRSQTDGNLGKIILYLCIFFESHISEFSIFNYQFSIRISQASH